MPVIKREFFHHEKGNHDETWYYLARDTDAGTVFIIHEWAQKANVGESTMEIEEFLRVVGRSSARDRFLQLIGNCVQAVA